MWRARTLLDERRAIIVDKLAVAHEHMLLAVGLDHRRRRPRALITFALEGALHVVVLAPSRARLRLLVGELARGRGAYRE